MLRRSPSPHAGVLAAPLVHARQVWSRRELVSFMVATQLRGKVFKTLLGPLWHLIPPVVQIGVYFVVVNYIFGRGGAGPLEHFVSISVGVLHWSFLNMTVNGASNAILSQENLLRQTPIPPIVFVFVNLREQLTHLAIKAAIAGVIMLAFGPDLTWRALLYPVWVLLLIANVWWIGVLIATLSVFFRDIEKATSIFTLLVMYLCPVIYGVDFLTARIGGVPILDVLMLNPLAVVMGMLKWSVLADPAVPAAHVAAAFATTGVMILVAHAVYERARPGLTKAL